MAANILMGGILIIIGLVMFLASFFNSNLFFNSNKAAKIIKFFGRTGARIFYFIFGILIIALGIMGAIGIFDKKIF